VVVTPWPPLRSGVSFYSLNLYQEVAKLAEVRVIGNKSSDITESKGLEVVRGWSPGIRGVFQTFMRCVTKRADLFHIQAELIVFQSILGTFLLPLMVLSLRLTRRPVVLTFHGVINLAHSGKLSYEPDDLQLRLFKRQPWLTRFIIRTHIMLLCVFANKVIVHNDIMKTALVEQYGIPMTKITTIPIGVKKITQTFNQQDESSSRKLLFLGFVRPSKGLENLIKALEKVRQRFPNVRLIIEGGLPFEEEKYTTHLLELIKTFGLNDIVEISGKMVNFDEIGDLIASANIIILPYLDDFLEASMVLGDIMDYGKPLICTRTPRFSGDLISGKECLMVQPGDVDALSEAILTLLEDTKLAETIGLNLKIKAQTRYWEIIASRLLGEVYGPLVMKSES
jgi:glycosyltransferase involved in cell wall biosynthesis